MTLLAVYKVYFMQIVGGTKVSTFKNNKFLHSLCSREYILIFKTHNNIHFWGTLWRGFFGRVVRSIQNFILGETWSSGNVEQIQLYR